MSMSGAGRRSGPVAPTGSTGSMSSYGTIPSNNTNTISDTNKGITSVKSGRAGDKLPWDTSDVEEGTQGEVRESTALLQQTLLLARDTEDKGYNVFHTLLQQGDLLQNTRDYLVSLGEVSSTAHDHIDVINQRLFRRKCQLWSIIIGMAVINMWLLVVLFRNGGSFFPHHH